MTDPAWRDEETLRRHYVEERKSMREIGDELGCSARTVCKWLDRRDIETRDSFQYQAVYRPEVPFRTYSEGYERWIHTYRGDRETVRVHRLVAVAEHGFEAVAEMDVHHENSIPWDNRPENLDVVDHAEHARIHTSDWTPADSEVSTSEDSAASTSQQTLSEWGAV